MQRLLLFYGLGIPFGFGLFLAGFRFGLFGSDTVLFYRGLKIIASAAVVQGAALAWAAGPGRAGVGGAHAFAATMASLALSVCFLIVVPVSLDRSVSVFLLGTMDRADRPVTRAELQDALIRTYIKAYGAVDRRVQEQALSGNVAVAKDGTLTLTPQGRAFLRLSRLLGPTFRLNMEYLDPPAPKAPTRSERAGR